MKCPAQHHPTKCRHAPEIKQTPHCCKNRSCVHQSNSAINSEERRAKLRKVSRSAFLLFDVLIRSSILNAINNQRRYRC
ncbi:hypothetical protein Y032_0025g1162 [Ancylostoma ceylanicum]|uniref:Uncharacterized protein n=1 Tax=Ancylostoma ceylanicum TaxID=53326 RepID=A0A016UWG8_9BILA|nr:hypothetical protein Y032_0025g1162 [Ancylostoma ceylanicum]